MAPVPTYESEEMLAKQAEEEESQGENLLAETVAELGNYGLDAQSVLLRGDAATEIIQYANENQVGLIVAGSLSRKLVHYAGCSVLIVKGGEHELV